MASVSYQIANLLEKMTSSDKDFRFMATDLMTELQNDSIKLDDDSERKVVKMLLRLLEDKNGEVQNLAVKCLGSLVNKVKEYQVETIVDALCGNMVSDKEQLRDISSIGLKTVISELPLASSALAANVCKRITGRLSSAIEKQQDVSVQLEALDILADLLSRFGSLLLNFHTTILAALLPQLSSPLQAVRKRTIVALSHLVMSCNNALYIKLIDFLLDGLSLNAATSTTRTYIQCIAAICRQAGHRFGEHIERVMPLIVQYSKEGDDELREYCLLAFEAFVHGCPKEITPHIHTIIELCLRYIAYDPNYNYDDEGDDGEDGVVMETEEEGDDDENDEYSDDDDMSWKVRRSAAKCLEAVIATHHELLCEFYKTVSPALIARFKEREENAKSDIFHAYMALLRQTRPSVGVSLDPDCMEQEEGPVCMLQNQVPAIVKAVRNQMKEKSIKTRQDCFTLLKELVVVLPGALTNHIPALIPGIQYSLGDKNSSSNMKIDTLVFVHCLLTSHSPEVFHNHMSVLVPPVITAVGDTFYKITAEALLVLQQLVKVIRPLDSPSNFDLTPFTSELYQCTLIRLKAADIDQEVKERAISCMGQIICNLGDYLQGELHTCLPIFLDRLRNEITCLTTVKALTKVAGSPLRIDLRPILGQAVPILGSYLRKNQRALKLSTLTLLDTLVRNYSSALNTELLNKVIIELAPLLSEADLHIAQLTLTLLTSIAQLHPAALTRVSDAILPEILTLVKSPLLQGAALNSMLEFFQALVKAGLPGLGHRDLLAMLIAPVSQSVSGSTPPVLHKQAFHSLAKCVAALIVTWPQEALGVVEQFLRDVRNPRSDAQHNFVLLVIGEIERHICEEQQAGPSFGSNAANRTGDELLEPGTIRPMENQMCMRTVRVPKEQYYGGCFICTGCKAHQMECLLMFANPELAKKVKRRCQSVHVGSGQTLLLGKGEEQQTNCEQRTYQCAVEPACDWFGQLGCIRFHIMQAHPQSLLVGSHQVLTIKLENLIEPSTLHNWVVCAEDKLFHVNLEIRRGETVQVLLGCVIFLGQPHRASNFKYTLMVGPNADDTTRRSFTFSRATHSYVESCSVNYTRGDCFTLYICALYVRENILKVKLKIEAAGNHQ